MYVRYLFWLTAFTVTQLLPAHLFAAVYEINANNSRVMIRVYRAGSLKAFGHNHIVSTSSITGKIDYDKGRIGDTRFQMTLPVSSFQVDDPQLRRSAGERFSKKVSDNARKGTRNNMLGKKVLQADQFPQILITSGFVRKVGAKTFNIELVVTILGVARTFTVPVALTEDNQTIVASSSFTLLQSNIGIKPLQAVLGTIIVADKLDIEAKIVAYKIKRKQ